MNWTDCPIVEAIPGKMSGAPVLRHSRVRPQDLLANIDEGAEWLAKSFRLPIADVCEVLSFYEAHQHELPLEYFSPERIAALGADIDWSGCPIIQTADGTPIIRHSRAGPMDLVAHREEGDEALAAFYGLSADAVRQVLSFYDRHTVTPLAPAV